MSREKFDHATIEPRGSEWRVYLWGHYPESSVLAGQPMRVYLHEGTKPECLNELAARHPGLRLEELEHASGKPYVSLAHLPGPDDPVPGGALPDDVGEWPPLP